MLEVASEKFEFGDRFICSMATGLDYFDGIPSTPVVFLEPISK